MRNCTFEPGIFLMRLLLQIGFLPVIKLVQLLQKGFVLNLPWCLVSLRRFFFNTKCRGGSPLSLALIISNFRGDEIKKPGNDETD